MDTATTAVLMLCFMSWSTVLSQMEMTILEADTPRMLREGRGLTLVCQFNQSLRLVLEYMLHWSHQPLVSGDQKPTLLWKQTLLENEDENSANFNVRLIRTEEHTYYTLQLIDAKPWMDGRYICGAVSQVRARYMEKSVMVMVPADVQYVQLNFDGEEVGSESDITVQRGEGDYNISCSTGGSNPSASLQLYLGEEPVPATLSDQNTRDVASEEATGARRFQQNLTVTNLKLSSQDNAKILKCVARAQFEGAVKRVASIPLWIMAGDSSGASSRSAAYVLCLLMAVLIWSL